MSDDLVRRLQTNGDVLRHIEAQAVRIAALEAALSSIARNTCCDKCQEAALVARAALEGGEDE